MAKITQNTINVYNYVKDHDGENFTVADIAEALGLESRSVNGIVTAAFQRKGLMTRVPATIETEDGKGKSVKFVKMTEEGMAWDPTAEADAE